MKLHYAGAPGDGYGWGVCNRNLIREFCAMSLAEPSALEFSWGNSIPRDVDVAFIPLADHDFNPASPVRGKVNLAYSFFESPLGPNAAANAAKYDTVFVGSTWCKERCAERGIHNTAVLIQGVDGEIFAPQPPRQPDGQFRIFSGGKFEYRKGQDLVIAAFAEFAKTHPEAHLVCAWFNPWWQMIAPAVEQSGLIVPTIMRGSYEELFADLLEANGIPRDRFTILPRLSQRDLAREMANTDCGLFPNRCEGGTNLVLMEYAATGRPVIANVATGHADIDSLIDCPIEVLSVYEENGWAVQKVDWIVQEMQNAFHDRSTLSGKVIPTWSAAAEKVMDTARKFLYQSAHVRHD